MGRLTVPQNSLSPEEIGFLFMLPVINRSGGP